MRLRILITSILVIVIAWYSYLTMMDIKESRRIELIMKNDSISILNDENKQSWSIIQDLVHEKNLLKKESDHLNERLNNWRKWYRDHEKDVMPENISFLINVIETSK